MNLLERILILPEELKRMVLMAILPTHIRVEYLDADWNAALRRQTLPVTPPDIILTTKTCQGPSIRLKYVDEPSTGIYHPSHYLTNKAWYAAVIDFITTITLWDLGDAEQLSKYRFRRCPPEQESQRSAFLRNISNIRQVCLNVYPFGTSISEILRRGTHDVTPPDMKSVARLPEIVHRTLTPCIVRIHLDGLATLTPKLWAKATALLRVFLIEVENWSRIRTSTSDRTSKLKNPPVIKIAYSKDDFEKNRGKALVKNIRSHSDYVDVWWVRTGECRYQGTIGDVVVKWDGETPFERKAVRKWAKSEEEWIREDGHRDYSLSSSALVATFHFHSRGPKIQLHAYISY